MSADQRDLREHVLLKARAADFRALREEYGDDVGILNDDGSWSLESDISAKQQDKSRARRFRDLATMAADAVGIAPGAHPFDSWMMRLRDHTHYVPVDVVVTTVPLYPHPLVSQKDDAVIVKSGWLNDVIHASIELCGTLEADAVTSQHAPFGAVVPVPADEAWAKTAKGRQTRITEFLQTLEESGVLKDLYRIHLKAGERSLRAHEKLIWEAAGYTDKTTLFAWKSCCKEKQSLAAAQKFLEVLRMTPVQFIAKWKKR